jgi:hypothetical protein
MGGDEVELPHVSTPLDPTVTCHNGTLLGFCTNPAVNTMPNKQLQMSSALLGLLRAPKALLFQLSLGKNNMMATKRLSQTSGFAPMILSIV